MMKMKNEFMFSEHKTVSTTKHYFAKHEFGEGVVLHDKLTASREFPELFPPDDTVVQNDIHLSNPDKDGRTEGFFIDVLGNKRDLKELCPRKLALGGDFADGLSVRVLKGMNADFDGNVWPLKKETRADKSVTRYRSVMNGLIARAAKK